MTIFFNAFHSPLGAHSSFTLGCKGQSGGLGLEMGGSACENVYIGVENKEAGFNALPFFEYEDGLESSRYDQDEKTENEEKAEENLLQPFNTSDITRDFSVCTDTWKAKDFKFSIISSSLVAPNPDLASESEQKIAYCPAVLAEIEIDNRGCNIERKAFFGYQGNGTTDSMNIVRNLPAGYCGVAKGRSTALVTDSEYAVAAQRFGAEDILKEKIVQNYNFGLGGTAMLIFNVPADKVFKCKVAVCFYRAGIVTSGEETSYWYARFFDSINSVAVFALENFSEYKVLSEKGNKSFSSDHLNDSQVFQLTHSIRSYYGSTQLLDWDDKPFWVVNEGEYRMMNTFDLTVDQLFFEMKMNPWTVKNELDMFVSRYSYTDKVHFPGGDNIYEGGISFTHDMGRCNHISRPQYSTYEMFGLDGCFSHMTHEQLVNWILCASVYVKQTDDEVWLKDNIDVFKKCLDSMLNRDNPDPAKRNGVMSLDSSRTIDGAEITTYDSLDESLGQARNNLYMALKSWAAYIALEDLLGDQKLSDVANKQAQMTAKTIVSAVGDNGMIPAIIGEDCESVILSAVEGLVFPYVMGMKDKVSLTGEYADLINALKTHFEAVLFKGICLYEDNGWKLSSTADNSWLSKIYLCQFIAREILEIKTPETGLLADNAHMNWLLKEENLLFAWSDQMHSGVALGSKYYPRGVTSVLWLNETS
jgi:xylan 1,4-beta-xylosidase